MERSCHRRNVETAVATSFPQFHANANDLLPRTSLCNTSPFLAPLPLPLPLLFSSSSHNHITFFCFLSSSIFRLRCRFLLFLFVYFFPTSWVFFPLRFCLLDRPIFLPKVSLVYLQNNNCKSQSRFLVLQNSSLAFWHSPSELASSVLSNKGFCVLPHVCACLARELLCQWR